MFYLRTERDRIFLTWNLISLNLWETCSVVGSLWLANGIKVELVEDVLAISSAFF